MRKISLNKISTEDKQLIEESYLELKSTYEVAKKLDLDRNLIYRYLKSANITMDGYTGPRDKYALDERFFQNIDSEEKAYWLGFLAADGNVRKASSGSWVCSLGLALKDLNHVVKFKQSLQSDVPIAIRKRKIIKQQSQAVISIVRNIFCKDLMSHGVIPNKTFILQFPEFDEKYIKHFMRGFFDGDGCWHIRTRGDIKQIYFRITCASYDFLKEYNDYIKIGAELVGRKIDKQTKTTYNLTYEGNIQCKRIYEYLYKDATIYLDRKFELATNHFNNLEEKALENG